jgi:hypothetical protein
MLTTAWLVYQLVLTWYLISPHTYTQPHTVTVTANQMRKQRQHISELFQPAPQILPRPAVGPRDGGLLRALPRTPTPPVDTNGLPISDVLLAPSHPDGWDKLLDFDLDRSPEELLDRFTYLDVDETCVQLAALLTDSRWYKSIMTWRGNSAQSLINLLQTVCLHPRLKYMSVDWILVH